MFDDLCGRGRAQTPVEEAAPGAPAPNDDVMAKLRADNDRLTRELAECKGKLRELEGGIEIELPEEVLFDTGRAVLRTSGKRLLDEIAAKIEREYPGYRVVVQGHTDSQPVVVHKRFFRSNWELGSARANAVIHYLESKGISIYKSESYAANKPAADNDTKEGRQRNRRSVIVLTAKK
jgi:chemotaxis protein MotB